MKLSHLIAISLLVLSACAGADESVELDSADARDARFLVDAKADNLGIPAEIVDTMLHHANTLTEDELDIDVALDARAARNIVAYRANGPFLTLEELDAVPWVGPSAFQKLVAYAQANPVIPAAACGDGIVDAGESCDDGNAISYDGCSATCTLETIKTTEATNVIGGFRRFEGGMAYFKDSSDYYGMQTFDFVATTTVTLKVKVHDGVGAHPVASYRDWFGNRGQEAAKFSLYIIDLNNPGSRLGTTTSPELEIDLPPGNYQLAQVARFSGNNTYTYDYVMDLEVQGELDNCLRRRGCQSEGYTELNKYEGTYGYYVNMSQYPYRSTVENGTIDTDSSTLHWPIPVGNTKRFFGELDSKRVKYFLVYLEEQQDFPSYVAEVLDHPRSSSGGFVARTTRTVYKFDPEQSGPGIPLASRENLEPGYYVLEVRAGFANGVTNPDRTTYRVEFR